MRLSRCAALALRAIWASRSPGEQTPWLEHRLVALDAAPVAATANDNTIKTPVGDAQWIQIATAGHYKGHAAGEFTLDALVFSQVVGNFRNHPSYVRGDNGLGAAFVIPFDWRHASEQRPNEGGPTAPLTQAAQGWALDLEMRSNTEDGKLQLWALTVILEPMKTLVAQKKVLWTSIAIWPNSPDPVTGANMGWYLSSVAFTNDPFIQGMQPIAADRTGGSFFGGSRYIDPYAPPGKPSEVLEALRRIFGLAELSGLADVLGQIATLRAAALGQALPPAGVDIAELVGALRILFNLPTLAPVEQVFAESDKLVAALAEELGSSQTKPTSSATTTTATVQRTEAPLMNELLQYLCSALGIVGAPTEAVVLAECKRRRLENGALRHLLDRVGGDKGGDGDAVTASAKIKALLGAAGVEDVDGATSQLVQRCSDVKNLMEMVPELEQMMAEASDGDDEESMEDVRTAMRVHYNVQEWDPTKLTRVEKDIANVMLSHRTGSVDLAKLLVRPEAGKPVDTAKFIASVKAVRAGLHQRKLARDGFRAEYLSEPEAPPAPGEHYLMSRLAAPGNSGTAAPAHHLARAATGQTMGLGRTAPAMFSDRPGAAPGPEKPLVDLELFQGNRSQRLLAAARKEMGEETFKGLATEQQFAAARQLGKRLADQGVDLTQYDVVVA